MSNKRPREEKKESYFSKPARTFSNQRQNRDCFAHVTARILSRLIKNIIPYHFSRTEEETDDCDNSYDVSIMDDVSKIIEQCSPGSKNSLLLYIYIYKLITRLSWGCDGGKILEVFEWFKRLITTKTLFDETLFDKPVEWSNLKDNIEPLLIDFLNEVEKRNLTFKIDMLILTPNILKQPTFNSYFLDKLKILKDRYYIGIVGDFGGSSHAMTLIDYYFDDKSGNIILKVKNSWGKITTTIGGLHQNEGIIIDSFENFRKAGLYELTTLRLETPEEKKDREDREKRYALGEYSDSDDDGSDEDEFEGGTKKTYGSNKVNKRISKKRKTKIIKKKNIRNTRKIRKRKIKNKRCRF
jgi:hypothetical protein